MLKCEELEQVGDEDEDEAEKERKTCDGEQEAEGDGDRINECVNLWSVNDKLVINGFL